MTQDSAAGDLDPVETREWLESIDSVLSAAGPERAHFLIDRMVEHARRSGAHLPYSPNTAYVNTIAVGKQPQYPGNRELERRIEAWIRWNAMAMVVLANRKSTEYGGHIASYASSATLYEVGFNHYWRAPSEQHPGDLVYLQGHSSPGIYARAYLEGRLSEDQLRRFRQEVDGGGLSSYPHPWLMPDFWQFPTVSMGLGPMMAIYQARFIRYLEHRGLVPPSDRKVWAFCGKNPLLKEMVANMSDEDIWRLNRGGHDARKVYAAYSAAMKTSGQPTVILAKTVKGFGLGKAAEGQMVAHQQKKLDDASLRELRDRFNIPVSDDDIAKLPFRKPAAESEEMRYLHERRRELAGYLPRRQPSTVRLAIPELAAFQSILDGTGEREISTTMAFVRILGVLLKDKNIGRHVVPIVPDEARTFGMEGLFRQIGIYSSMGQLYTPQDADQLMSYREDKQGQMLEEGINEAGSVCSWIAAATSYANLGVPMVPFYIYYSMFDFQRVGDFIWAPGDMRARGFLLGGTAGRTTLAGEGLQHQDGHSHLLATTVPNCRAYDPTYAYELAVIIQDGMRRMYGDGEGVFYYITVMNENYAQPALPPGAEAGILRGGYRLHQGGQGHVRHGALSERSTS